MEEQTFTLATADFDASLLPAGARAPGTPAFRQEVTGLLERAFTGFGGRVTILVDEHRIAVRWNPDSTARSPLEFVVAKLQSGQRAEGIQLLEFLLSREPENVAVLYNLGVALSDAGKLGRAEECLRRAVELAPEFTNALTALGVALSRQQKNDDAIQVLRSALRLEAQNPWALLNLGVALLKQGKHDDAVDHLRKAVELRPDDQPSLVALGDARRLAGQAKDAEVAYAQAIRLNPHSDHAEMARRGSSQLAQSTFKSRTSGAARPDAVEYCRAAIKEFSGRSEQEVKNITFEIAMLGREGLDVNSPERKYRLKTMPGEFSGLRLSCYMYVGFQIVAPGTDIGFDLRREYEIAKSMSGQS